MRPKRRNSIEGVWVGHRIEMLRSPSWRVLSLSTRRVLDRLEIEHADHGGAENGRLVVTFNQFVEFGIDRHAIAPAIRELEALKLVEVTERGTGGNSEHRRPSRYRLTYLNVRYRDQPTDDWKRVATIEQAEALAKTARASPSRPPKKQKPSVGKHTVSVLETHTEMN